MTQPYLADNTVTTRLYGTIDALIAEGERARLSAARKAILSARDKAWGRRRSGLTEAAEIVAGLLAETERTA